MSNRRALELDEPGEPGQHADVTWDHAVPDGEPEGVVLAAVSGTAPAVSSGEVASAAVLPAAPSDPLHGRRLTYDVGSPATSVAHDLQEKGLVVEEVGGGNAKALVMSDLPGAVAIDMEGGTALQSDKLVAGAKSARASTSSSSSSSSALAASRASNIVRSSTTAHSTGKTLSSRGNGQRFLVDSRSRDACTQTKAHVSLPDAPSNGGSQGVLELPSARAMELLSGGADAFQHTRMERPWSSGAVALRPASRGVFRRNSKARNRWKKMAARAAPQRRSTLHAMTLRRNAVAPTTDNVLEELELDSPRRLQAR